VTCVRRAPRHMTGALEQSLLYLLAANAGRLLTREDIVNNLCGDVIVDSKAVDRHVRDLRVESQDNPRPQFIATVSGRGYRFVPPLSQDQRAAAAV